MGLSTKEAKRLLYEERPVIFAGTKYKKINALIFRKVEGRYRATAELLDMNHNSVVIAPIEWIDDTDEEPMEILGQEEVVGLTERMEEEMAALKEKVSQGKPEEGQDTLHRLLSVAIKLDANITRQIQLQADYKNKPEIGMEVAAEEIKKAFSFGEDEAAINEDGKEKNIPQMGEEEQWKNI